MIGYTKRMKEVVKLNNQTKGILCIIAASLGFSLMTFFVKMAGDLPTMEKAFFRNFVALIVAAFLLIKSGDKFAIKSGCKLDVFLRCLFGTSGLIANFYAIDKLNIADSNMLNKMSPFFAIIVSVFLLKEKPSKIDIIATVTAFIGVLFVVRPTGDMAMVPGLIGLYGGFAAGVAYTFVRKLGKKGEKTRVIVFCFSAFSCLVTLPGFVVNFVPMSTTQFVFLLLAGLSATIGQFGITSAYKFSPAKRIAVFDYTQVVFAALLGLFFLNETPHILSIIGYVIIIGVAVIRSRINLRTSEEIT